MRSATITSGCTAVPVLRSSGPCWKDTGHHGPGCQTGTPLWGTMCRALLLQRSPVAASSRPPLSATTGYRVRGPVPLASRRWFKLTQRVLGRDWPTAYLFIALIVFLLGTIKAYPFLKAMWYSFHRVIGFQVGAFVGLDNYIAMWG